jgi:CDP-diacylglycerol--glycerol-3-phosphate 3-phosphatidyltransferase
MGPVLWVIAVLSTITVIHRIRYTHQQLALIEPPPVPVRPDPLKFEEIVG